MNMQGSDQDDRDANLFNEDKQPERIKKQVRDKEEEDDEEEEDEFEDSQNEDDDDNQEDDEEDEEEQEQRHGKRKRRHGGEKKKKKKKKGRIESFLEDEADESDRDEEDDDDDLDDAELRNVDAKKRAEEYYKKPKRNESLLQLLHGKNEEQIMEIMQKRNYNQYIADTNCPSLKDPKVYQVPVVKGKQDTLTLAILNKASQLKDSEKALAICSVMSMKRKFPGYIFVEAMSELAVKTSLEGFLDVIVRQMLIVKDDQYQNLFKEKDTQSTTLKEQDYIRIRGGRYDGDLGKIYKLRKNGPEVILQPRIDITKCLNQIKAITDSDITDKDKSYVKVIKRHFSSQDISDHKFRPDKTLIFNDQLPNINISRKPKMTTEGMIILPFSFADVTKQLGGITFKEIEAFKKDDGLAEFARKELKYLSSTVNIAKGDQVEVMYGEIKGVYGIVKEVNNNIAVIEAKNNPRLGVFEEQIEKLGKRFRIKQRVTVMSGNHQGREGIILKIESNQATILTENNNEIVVNTNNLKVSDGTTKTQETVSEYRKNDLVLTLGVGDGVGMVLSASKDSLTVVDLNNSIKVINVIDVDKKLDTKNNKAINTYKEQIKQGATVRISEGKYAGRKVEVRHVYKNNLFVTSNDIGTPNGAYVIKDTNCTVITQSSKFTPRQMFGANKNNFKSQNAEDEALAPGNTITIKSGEYKGYQGQIVNTYAGKVEIKLTAKLGKKVIVDASDIIQQKTALDIGKTPRVSGSSYVPQSPGPIGMGESRRDRGYYE